ncbi:protein of unknown function [Mucilaginibacter gossypiicola]|uniref:DUF4920 domain-containing protein n=1 Tax=Mucilaginibacter gossypiicola TaxID=551995 RepID=A0A1H8TBC7_9SPHI|nr:DUF4920 domain-containing protein [Mucilaginibacter gossypiicola]SEO87783.1 protein of unknown function [Mucilaginibacter gossypiicola]
MKLIVLLISILIANVAIAQKHVPLPHGMVFGEKPDTITLMQASKLETFMGKKTRITTAITGKVIKVIKEKGGWFELDAGKNRVIGAHFTNAGINLPKQLAGRTVIISGIAAKQFIADDLQHMAGDTVSGKKQHKVNTNSGRKISFEVKGLMIDQ